MSFVLENSMLLLFALTFIIYRKKYNMAIKKQDKQYTELQSLALSYLLKEFPIEDAYSFKPVNIPQKTWESVIDRTYNATIY